MKFSLFGHGSNRDTTNAVALSSWWVGVGQENPASRRQQRGSRVARAVYDTFRLQSPRSRYRVRSHSSGVQGTTRFDYDGYSSSGADGLAWLGRVCSSALSASSWVKGNPTCARGGLPRGEGAIRSIADTHPSVPTFLNAVRRGASR